MFASDSRYEQRRDSDDRSTGGDSFRPIEPTRELRLPDDVQPWPFQGPEGDGDSMMADEYEILYLEETGGWALMLPEGAVLHGHGPSGNDEEEEVFYECEAVETAGQESAIRCIECGLMISESRIEELIDTLDNEIEDEGEGGQG